MQIATWLFLSQVNRYEYLIILHHHQYYEYYNPYHYFYRLDVLYFMNWQGSSIIRMLQHFLGKSVFQKGLTVRIYPWLMDLDLSFEFESA